MKIRLYANTEELQNFFAGGRNTFKASYDRVSPLQTAIEVESTEVELNDDAVENVDVTPNQTAKISIL